MKYSDGYISLKPRRRVKAKDIRGMISVKVELEEIEEALGRED